VKEPPLDKDNKHDREIDDEYKLVVNDIISSDKLQLEPVSVLEIQKLIKKLKNKKSSGYDDVSNYMIKMLPPAYVQCLTKCFNIWLQRCQYPEFWKLAKLVTLNKLKAGVPRTDQTRPISLLL
jgi:hypothetical protein